MDKLNGQSFFALQIFPSQDKYPQLYVIGGPDVFKFSLSKSLDIWKEYHRPDEGNSNWRAFGLGFGYHNHEVNENELCDKENTGRAILHFCTNGEWLADIPYKDSKAARDQLLKL
jgi:hypothetical protein